MSADRKADPEAREQEEERQGPVVRDKRRIDPETGAVRTPGAPESAHRPQRSPAHSGAQQEDAAEGRTMSYPGGPRGAEPPAGDEVAALQTQLAERTGDLQRIQAEYANYRKRVDRDRIAVREQALANVLIDLLPVLDDIDRARRHGELTGGFQKVAESFEGIVTKLGLGRFGEKDEPFDPTVHEALMHSYSDEVTEPTAVEVLQPGYAVAGRILRPARVAVAEPPDPTSAPGEPAEPLAPASARDAEERDVAADADDTEQG